MMKAVGMSEILAKTLTTGNDAHRMVQVEQLTEIADNIWVTGPIPRINDFEDADGTFYFDSEGLRPDPVNDDQALCVRTAAGMVVVLGCGHAGLVNTLQYVHEQFPGIPIDTVIGGMHIKDNHTARLERTVNVLRALAVHRIVPSHCTGASVLARLTKVLQQRCETCQVGKQWFFSAAG